MLQTIINDKQTADYIFIQRIFFSSIIKISTLNHIYKHLSILFYIHLIDMKWEKTQMLKTMNRKELTEHDRKLKEYYWKCFLSEFSKICIFLLIFTLLDLTTEYFFALLYLIILRNNGGGLHCKHYISCLLVSFTFLYSGILLAIYVIPTRLVACTSIILCALLGYHLVPITSRNRPPATPKQITKAKRNTLTVILLFSLLICICPYNTSILIGYWTVILHILQLIVANLIKKEVNIYG